MPWCDRISAKCVPSSSADGSSHPA
jgi:hypothetical protein